MKTPILFIHGFGGDEKQYQALKKYLTKRGIDNFYEFKYENKFGFVPIKTIAKELSEFIKNEVREQHINIIGMSQGGIIALTYVKYFKNINVNKIFTLCSPFKGSKLAKIMNLPGLIDLRPGSNLLKELDFFIKENKMNIYCVYTPFDLMVFPGWNARCKYGKKKIVFAPTHPAVFLWPASMRFIYRNIIK